VSANDSASARPIAGYLRDDPLLRLDDVVCTFRGRSGAVQAVAGVSFDVLPGETLGLVGESGCGKTTTGRAILQLPPPTSGSVWFEGRDLAHLPKQSLRDVRMRLQMIFQDPVSAFNPRRRVRDVVAEGLVIAKTPKHEIARRVEDALEQVGMNADQVGSRRPHEFSGGQSQRIAIARALALQPKLIVCDEPVASLDVSVQAQVLNVLHDVKQRNDLSLVFISHDLAVVRNVSDRIAVMYLGKIVEIGDADRIYDRPAHPYTRMLLEAVPVPDANVRVQPGQGPRGEAPSPANPPSGCRFRTRCPRAQQICADVEPPLTLMPGGQHAACHFPHHEPATIVDNKVVTTVDRR
jgi:peptide/nickel transport system ATP-binding protein